MRRWLLISLFAIGLPIGLATVSLGDGPESAPSEDVEPTDPLDPAFERGSPVLAPDEVSPPPDVANPIATAAYGCTSVSEELGFPNFFAGNSYDGLALTGVSRDCSPPPVGEPAGWNSVTYVYGECTPDSGGGCAPPIQIQSWPLALRNSASFEAAEQEGLLVGEDTTLDGIPATWYEDQQRLELWRPDVTVVIFGEDPAQIEAFASELVEGPNVLKDLEEMTPIQFDPACVYDENHCVGAAGGA